MLNPNEILVHGFHHHGHSEAYIDGEWIVIPGYPPARAFAYPYDTNQGYFNLQLDIQFALDDGRTLVESVAGLGKDEAEALSNGFSKFAANSFHVVLAAFYDHAADDQINIHEWDISGQKWEVFIGPFGIMRLGGETTVDPSDFSTLAHEKFFAFIEDQIKSWPLSKDTHWTRSYYAQQDGVSAASEVLWDNQLWQEGREKLVSLDWPHVAGFASIRSFIVLRKKGAAKQVGAAENAMGIERALSILLNYCGQHPQAADEEIRQQLVSAQIPASLANRILIFGPMCFSRRILRDSFPTEYLVYVEESPLPARKLDEEPVFAVGSQYAMAVAAEPEKKDAFMAVARRCALFKTANQALNAGSKLEDLVFSPPVVYLDESSPSPLE